jgi:hypothetical protein
MNTTQAFTYRKIVDGRFPPRAIFPPASGARLIDVASRIIGTRAPKFMPLAITWIGRSGGQSVNRPVRGGDQQRVGGRRRRAEAHWSLGPKRLQPMPHLVGSLGHLLVESKMDLPKILRVGRQMVPDFFPEPSRFLSRTNRLVGIKLDYDVEYRSYTALAYTLMYRYL